MTDWGRTLLVLGQCALIATITQLGGLVACTCPWGGAFAATDTRCLPVALRKKISLKRYPW